MVEDHPQLELSSAVCYASESFYGAIVPEMSDPRNLKIAVIGAGKSFPHIGPPYPHPPTMCRTYRSEFPMLTI
jgi:hypothetical protein